MTPRDILVSAIDPACAQFAPLGIPSDDRARVLLLAIAGQESGWSSRLQVGGPARGWWQCEGGPESGLSGLFRANSRPLQAMCACLYVPFGLATVYEAVAWNDVLAAAVARLLLWSDPAPLPAVGDADGGWATYARVWGPGSPHPEIWPARYGTALGLINNNPQGKALSQ